MFGSEVITEWDSQRPGLEAYLDGKRRKLSPNIPIISSRTPLSRTETQSPNFHSETCVEKGIIALFNMSTTPAEPTLTQENLSATKLNQVGSQTLLSNSAKQSHNPKSTTYVKTATFLLSNKSMKLAEPLDKEYRHELEETNISTSQPSQLDEPVSATKAMLEDHQASRSTFTKEDDVGLLSIYKLISQQIRSEELPAFWALYAQRVCPTIVLQSA